MLVAATVRACASQPLLISEWRASALRSRPQIRRRFLVEIAHLCSLIHQPLDVFKVLHRAFRQVLDVRTEGRVFSDFEGTFVVVGRVEQVANLCTRATNIDPPESGQVVAKRGVCLPSPGPGGHLFTHSLGRSRCKTPRP